VIYVDKKDRLFADNEDDLRVLLKQYYEQAKKEQMLAEKYPPNPPNDVCYHALMSGILIENSFGPMIHDYIPFFNTEYEKIFIWTHSKNAYSVLISEVKTEVKNKRFWKNVGTILYLAMSYFDAFEGTDEERIINYNWIYYFDPNLSLDDMVLYNINTMDQKFLMSGIVKKATEIENMSQIIELLLRDDVCFTALSQMVSSFQSHYCCLICELGLSPVMMHNSHEPSIWEHGYLIPKMETGIVQACKCVESILGEPPNRHKRSRLIEHKKKWKDLLGIDADDTYKKSKSRMSYLDFYYHLFDELRNPSAHSYGNIHFDLERKKTIEAQCFAALILREYINKHIKSNEQASGILNFNKGLLERVSENMSTKLTK
jgi:hypothetical protein